MISFNGDKMRWLEFWDSFEGTIHSNKRLSKLKKFNYVKSKPEGSAKH